MTNWNNEPSPHLADYYREQREQEARAAAETNRARFESLKVKFLDRVDTQLDAISVHQQNLNNGTIGDALPPSEARRRLAHIVGTPSLCSHKACRRSHACRGEPKHCLAVALPLLPPEVVAKLALGQRKTRRGRAR
jgi:hypothetical protein